MMNFEANEKNWEYIAFGPDDSLEMKRPEEWQGYIKAHLKDFNGNTEGAASILARMVFAVNWLKKKMIKAGYANFAPPQIEIVVKKKVPLAVFCHEEKQNVLLIDMKYLSWLSEFHPDSTFIQGGTNGELVFTGKPAHIAELAAVEESRHAFYDQFIESTGGDVDPGTMPSAQYDALDWEFDGLQWQINYGEDMDYPEETMRLLRQRYENARIWRENNFPNR
jgi:hypothetical protein